nr:thioesterase [uncultured bacterium]|tara:strand:+ start:46 stop:555 length:510 start_codon:yes stop_codon:yes gene_type:complete
MGCFFKLKSSKLPVNRRFMKITSSRVNTFMFFKLPLGWWSGMRVKSLTDTTSVVRITYKWINQNPFKSMFWAAQGMAAEMSTGVLVMQEIERSKRKVSMLVIHQEGDFFKKAIGEILFTCNGGDKIREAIETSIETGKGQEVTLISEGKNLDGVVVSNFQFHWSLKVKN